MALDEKGRNTRLELEYTQKAIELGERHAMCHLASYYLDHCSTDKEKVREATQLMEQAESMGALLECRRIGYAYALQGLYDKAFPRYLKGAEEGDSFCQFCTGLYYKNGQGVEQDYAKAIYWYEMARTMTPDPTGGGFCRPDCYGFIPDLQLCMCHFKLGELQKAEHYNQLAEQLKPEDQTVLHNKTYFESLRTT